MQPIPSGARQRGVASRALVFILGLLLAVPGRGLAADSAAAAAREVESPVNQVFQFMFESGFRDSDDAKERTACSFLWIPERCAKLQGLLILCHNVPEQRLVGHPAIRAVCAAHDLGIVWSNPTFMNFGAKARSVVFLEQQLDGLARVSGYDEVATVPLLPLGESMHLQMVHALVEERPDRVIAGVLLKNAFLPPKNRQTPILAIDGTAYEWGQDKTDIRTSWNNTAKLYDQILRERASHPAWPLSYIIDGHSGHFDCSERIVASVARYIDLAVQARLPRDGRAGLERVKIASGFTADLPVPGHEGKPVVAAAAANPPAAFPWYFDEASAKEAQAIAAINWTAESQFPGLLGDDGKPLAKYANGVLVAGSPSLEPDGITFALRGTLLDRLPEGFVGAGEPLAKAPGTPAVEWISGPVATLGQGRFRIALDRNVRDLRGNATAHLGLRQAGTDTVRGILEPFELHLPRNTQGVPQTIAFDAIADVVAGTEEIPLSARSSAGLPMAFFVIAGPATVEDGKLALSGIPPRSKFPIHVTVAAWQWGRASEPRVQSGEIVKRQFRILAP